MEDVRHAIRLTHTLWGGRYNPIIPVAGAQSAAELVRLFRVDALYAVADDAELKAFAEGFRFLPWPRFERDLFTNSAAGKVATFLDIYHPVRHLYGDHIKGQAEPKVGAKLYHWDATEALADVLLAYFGSYPSIEEVGIDYGRFVEKNLRGTRTNLGPADPIPQYAFRELTPSAISAYSLEPDHVSHWFHAGIYVGQASDFDDIVNFWNLRAADIDLIFYDPAHAARLQTLRDAYLAVIQERPTGPPLFDDLIPVWSKEGGIEIGREQFKAKILRGTVETNVPDLQPPLMRLSGKSVLASVSDDRSASGISVQLPRKRFYDEPEFRSQSVVVSVHPFGGLFGKEDRTIRTPFIPELNEFYARELYWEWNAVRAEVEGFGVITPLWRDDLTIRPLETRQLACKIFEAFGMKAEPSHAGRIAVRLIQQMGGIQGCRVFKITGVRKLIERYGPLESFTRGAATAVIAQIDPGTGKPSFGNFEDLYIAPREKSKLTADDAFTYLVKQGVFRAGLELRCTNCDLEFWLPLDDLAREVVCEYCGEKFDISPQLKDRDWRYRRSGLFGREDHQEGGIPVALTLQQLETHVDLGRSVWTTGINIRPATAKVGDCETDFVFIGQGGPDGLVELAIGECKPGGRDNEITEEDVANLAAVANAFPSERIRVYLVFAKAGPFSPEEVQRCRAAQASYYPRIIMLSERELEPYFVYERTEKEFDVRGSAISLDELAVATHDIYFEPRLRATTGAKAKAAAVGAQSEGHDRNGKGDVHAERVETASATSISKYSEIPLEELRRVYELHHSESGKQFPPEKQCQCESCGEYRVRSLK